MKRSPVAASAALVVLFAGAALGRSPEKPPAATTTTTVPAAAPASPLAAFVGRWAGYEEIRYVNGCSGGDRIVIDVVESSPGKYTGVLTYRNSSCRLYGKNAPETLTVSHKDGRIVMTTPKRILYEGTLANGMLSGEVSGDIIRKGTWNAQGPQ